MVSKEYKNAELAGRNWHEKKRGEIKKRIGGNEKAKPFIEY